MEAHLESSGGELDRLLRAIAAGHPTATRLLEESPGLATAAATTGATRAEAERFFLEEIGHYIYAGDTALHIAAAGYRSAVARELLRRGADPRARNRRGVQPLHYAAKGHPGSPRWDAEAQATIIEILIRAGADPAAADRSGVLPLHVAVRTRSAAAVRALLALGADARACNGSGSTPLHLAVQDTGRSGAGSALAREQQAEIVRLLLQHGADRQARDGRGRTVDEKDSRRLLEG